MALHSSTAVHSCANNRRRVIARNNPCRRDAYIVELLTRTVFGSSFDEEIAEYKFNIEYARVAKVV